MPPLFSRAASSRAASLDVLWRTTGLDDRRGNGLSMSLHSVPVCPGESGELRRLLTRVYIVDFRLFTTDGGVYQFSYNGHVRILPNSRKLVAELFSNASLSPSGVSIALLSIQPNIFIFSHFHKSAV